MGKSIGSRRKAAEKFLAMARRRLGRVVMEWGCAMLDVLMSGLIGKPAPGTFPVSPSLENRLKKSVSLWKENARDPVGGGR